MTEVKNSESSHKKIAMEFLLSANKDLDEPISARIIEKVYDLFAEENSDVQSFQRGLQKIINPSENQT